MEKQKKTNKNVKQTKTLLTLYPVLTLNELHNFGTIDPMGGGGVLFSLVYLLREFLLKKFFTLTIQYV